MEIKVKFSLKQPKKDRELILPYKYKVTEGSEEGRKRLNFYGFEELVKSIKTEQLNTYPSLSLASWKETMSKLLALYDYIPDGKCRHRDLYFLIWHKCSDHFLAFMKKRKQFWFNAWKDNIDDHMEHVKKMMVDNPRNQLCVLHCIEHGMPPTEGTEPDLNNPEHIYYTNLLNDTASRKDMEREMYQFLSDLLITKMDRHEMIAALDILYIETCIVSYYLKNGFKIWYEHFVGHGIQQMKVFGPLIHVSDSCLENANLGHKRVVDCRTNKKGTVDHNLTTANENSPMSSFERAFILPDATEYFQMFMSILSMSAKKIKMVKKFKFKVGGKTIISNLKNHPSAKKILEFLHSTYGKNLKIVPEKKQSKKGKMYTIYKLQKDPSTLPRIEDIGINLFSNGEGPCETPNNDSSDDEFEDGYQQEEEGGDAALDEIFERRSVLRDNLTDPVEEEEIERIVVRDSMTTQTAQQVPSSNVQREIPNYVCSTPENILFDPPEDIPPRDTRLEHYINEQLLGEIRFFIAKNMKNELEGFLKLILT